MNASQPQTAGALGNGTPVLSVVVLPHETIREAIYRTGRHFGVEEGFLDMTAAELRRRQVRR